MCSPEYVVTSNVRGVVSFVPIEADKLNKRSACTDCVVRTDTLVLAADPMSVRVATSGYDKTMKLTKWSRRHNTHVKNIIDVYTARRIMR